MRVEGRTAFVDPVEAGEIAREQEKLERADRTAWLRAMVDAAAKHGLPAEWMS